MPPRSVIIVGGSIAGLLQGLQLKRQGSDVIILEQDPSKERHSHESGIQIGPSVTALLDKYDTTGRPKSIAASAMSFSWRRRARAYERPSHHDMSNWGCLFNLLRANFDGMASAAVPDPPGPKPEDGKVEYRSGKRVTGLVDDREKERVHVQFFDVTTGEKGNLAADLVIGADGIHSTIRGLLGAKTRKEYAGYVAWRGAVPERLVSKEAVEALSDRLNFFFLGKTYLVSYIIPTEQGNNAPGERLVNWLWYYTVPDNSSEMRAIFTDVQGKVHPNTVSQGLVQPEIWAELKSRFLPQMLAPLAEVIDATPRPFVTKVCEAQCSRASFYEGRVVLVGDAFTALRSHLGMASEQAATHCGQMDRVWRGEISQAQRDREATLYARKFLLLNRLVGVFGLEMPWAVLQTVVAYLWLMIMVRLGLS